MRETDRVTHTEREKREREREKEGERERERERALRAPPPAGQPKIEKTHCATQSARRRER